MKNKLRKYINKKLPTFVVGIDVHKSSYHVEAQEMTGGEMWSKSMKADPEELIRFLKEMTKDYGAENYVLCGYEAGPTGAELQRALSETGYDCDILPLKFVTPFRKNKRIKTDKRDAYAILQCLIYQEYEPVYVPKEIDEQTKKFIRARETHLISLKKIKQQINSFLLISGYKYKSKNGKNTKWTKEYFQWMKDLELSETDRYILDGFLEMYFRLSEMLKEYDKGIKQIAQSDEYRERVKILRCFKGIDYLIALAVIVEIGDFTRFEKPGELASFLGLVPGEYSSGMKSTHTGITKTGNKFLRRLLILAAQAIARSKTIAPTKRQLEKEKNNSPEMINYAARAHKRMKQKFYRLVFEKCKNRNVAITAIARELTCFIWGAMTNNIM